ncbi:MAG: putative RNA methylase [Candidatus Methanohalarchaeum thermophilum]|uniref:Methyltransferase-like protein 5 n=1 Tax=Methanohalarchaeum thermophilum TaxID=1903181 RepID=A0A1Q6DXX4_METT1|nr:MAG: putative RNA methylase [Candidatus Methanohalarchaeum thermophilum]
MRNKKFNKIKMKKKQLEIKLQKLKGYQNPIPGLEQYLTPAALASAILNYINLDEGFKGKKVIDLGSGTGTLAIGAKLLGAEKVVGVEKDPDAIKIARENRNRLDLDIDYVNLDVREFNDESDLVIQNPPFGSQKKGNDRPFIEKSLSIAPIVYSIHKTESRNFIEKFITELDAEICVRKKTGFPIERTFNFHEEDVKKVNVDFYKFIRNQTKNRLKNE